MKDFGTWRDIWMVMYRLECIRVHQDLRARQAWLIVILRVSVCTDRDR